MRTWITSDTHWGHANIMKFCPETRARFNGEVGRMNEEMIKEWNSRVEPEDLVYLLGDVAFCSASDAARILNRLNGDKILIEGNHDRKNIKDVSFRTAFKEIHKYLDINYAGHKIVMFHYPIAEFDQQHRGAIHFHGHLHGDVSGLEHYRVMDVGMDATGEIVVSMEYAINRALQGKIKGHH